MRKFFVAIACVLPLFWSCQPEADTLRLLDDLVVSTNYDTDANFAGYSTYSISTDTIGFVSNKSPNDTIIIQSDSNYPRPVLQKVQSNLNSLGYTRVEKKIKTRIGVSMFTLLTTSIFSNRLFIPVIITLRITGMVMDMVPIMATHTLIPMLRTPAHW